MKTENLYAERDSLELGDYYMRHVDRMTREGLHDKSDIAAELGWRDMEIDRLRARVAELEAGRDGGDALRECMADILKRTAVALRGPEPPLTAWPWHDLPERAAAAIAKDGA